MSTFFYRFSGRLSRTILDQKWYDHGRTGRTVCDASEWYVCSCLKQSRLSADCDIERARHIKIAWTVLALLIYARSYSKLNILQDYTWLHIAGYVSQYARVLRNLGLNQTSVLLKNSWLHVFQSTKMKTIMVQAHEG